MSSDNESTLLSDCTSATDSSDDLSVLSRSPTPPGSLTPFQLATPTSSQHSSDAGSDVAEDMDSAINGSSIDGQPPKKRRRVEKSRTTEYLDLRSSTLDEAQQHQLDRLVRALRSYQKIVVVAGAGISVSAGIPDFRSSTGLFTSLRAEHNLKGSGKHLFDASVYKDDSSTSSFHDMVRNLSKMTKDTHPTVFHHMLATLALDGRLLRLYTQNVDGIDVGMPPLETTVPLAKHNGVWPKSVQLHGGLAKMVCSKCKELWNFDADLFDGPEAPVCTNCVEVDRLRTELAGKRSHGIGRLRPRMVLYNEHNPDDEAIGRVVQDDLRKRPDAIIVVGTSLKIPGVRRIVKEMCGVVRNRRNGLAVWINHDPEPAGVEFKDCWDIVVRGKCDVVAEHAQLRRWYQDKESYELTEDEYERAKERSGFLRINPAYKEVRTDAPFFRPSTKSPEFTPMTVRHKSFMDPYFNLDSSVDGAPPTPSKSASPPPSRKRDVQAAFSLKFNSKSSRQGEATRAAGGKKATKQPRPRKRAAPSKKAAVNMVPITLSMKQTKAFAAPEGKTGKASRKSSVMQDVPNEDVRNNSPPELPVTPKKTHLSYKPRTPMFPGLSPSVAKVEDANPAGFKREDRMSISRLVS